MQGRSNANESPYRVVIKITRGYFKVFMSKMRALTSVRWINGQMPDDFYPFRLPELKGHTYVYISLDHSCRLQWHRSFPKKHTAIAVHPCEMLERTRLIGEKTGPKKRLHGDCDLCGCGPTNRDSHGLTRFKGRTLCGDCLIGANEQRTDIEPQTLRTSPVWYEL